MPLEHQMVWRRHGRSSSSQTKVRGDVELLLSVTGLPWDLKRPDPTIKVSVHIEDTVASRSSFGQQSLDRAGGDGGQGRVPCPQRMYIRKNVGDPEVRSNSQDVKVVLQSPRMESRSTSHNNAVAAETSRISAIHDEPNVSKMVQETGKVEIAPEQQQQWSNCGERRSVRTSRNMKKTAEDTGFPSVARPRREPTRSSLHTVETMRLEELTL